MVNVCANKAVPGMRALKQIKWKARTASEGWALRRDWSEVNGESERRDEDT